MDFTPSLLQRVTLACGHLELVEWRWPSVINFVRTEPDLMIEMSVPPFATDASAEFPDVAPGQRCFMGTLFVRYPGVAVHGRGEGGQIRVIRVVFSASAARSILETHREPALPLLQSLLNIRSAALRTLMRLAHRELTNEADRSVIALDAILELLAIELRRLLEQSPQASPGGRLAAWQYRRIRERLTETGKRPTVVELAELCGISPRHLHRQFKALTGTKVAKYVESFQIERAKQMLVEGSSPIQHIAYVCGFSRSNSFARAFRRATGVPPLMFRHTAARNTA